MINKIKKIKGLALSLPKGFTLIETLVAVLLLVTAVAGPLTIASKGLSAAIIARDQMVAFYLAQDAVEYVRFVRDSNKLAGTAWLTGTVSLDACQGAAGCTIDQSTNPPTIAACPAQGCDLILKHDDGVVGSSKYFTYVTSDSNNKVTPQRFRRTVTITTPAAGEAILTAQVSWRAQSGATRFVTVRENLYDWQI